MNTDRLKSSSSGFTLLELVVVVTIVGIIGYVFVARYQQSHGELQYKTLVRKIATDVRYARELAMTSGRGTSVVIDIQQNRYSLQWADGTDVENPMGGGSFVVELGQGDFAEARITRTAFANGRLDFMTTGLPLNSGSPFVGKLTLLELNHAVQITITANTGLVQVEQI